MFNSKKYQYEKLALTLIGISLFACTSFAADKNYGNIPPDPNDLNIDIMMLSMGSIQLPFDPNDYSFLIYDSNGNEDRIEEAMDYLGIPYDRRGPGQGNEVTLIDLLTHNILIVGWNVLGDTSGIDDDILSTGIKGRVVLSGHDLDFHTAPPSPGWYRQASEKMLIQSINYILQGDGTGLITLGCTDGFPYLPTEWGVRPDANQGGDDVNEFTQEGLESGVYDGLEPNDMDNWGTSYHDRFTIEQGSDFVVFERGGYDGNDNITVARTHSIILPPDCIITLNKTDNIGDGNCVNPSIGSTINSYINYTISYSTTCDIKDVNIIDYLSEYVTFNSCTGGGVYEPNSRTVRWNLHDVNAYDSDSFTLRVRVAENAPQGHTVANKVKMYSGIYPIKTKTIHTEICCLYNPIYVNDDANDGGDGLTWQTAFNDLQYAIDFAATEECFDTIYVAAGTYKPTEDGNLYDANFALRDGIALFGHFSRVDYDPADRNLADANNATILQGQIEPGYSVYNVVTADGVTDAQLDGFTITGASDHGIYLDNDSNIAVYNSIITANGSDGLYITGASDAQLHNCTVSDNYYGISSAGPVQITLSDCIFYSNSLFHINLSGNDSKTLTATSCLFDGNDITGYGIYAQENSTVSVSDSTFTGHTGCAVYTLGQTLNVLNSNIIGSALYGYDWGISATYSNTTIKNCVIESPDSGSDQYGISDSDGTNLTVEDSSITNWSIAGIRSAETDNVSVRHCKIIGGNYGINIYGSDNNVTIDRCIIAETTAESGLNVSDVRSAAIRNCWIYGNSCGLNLSSNSYAHTVRNNTIAYNTSFGIKCSGTAPNITNCIIWNPNGDDLYGCTATYSCIYDNDTGTGIIHSDPCFYNYLNDDYHLKGNSPCKDYRSVTYSNETDIDGENRTLNGKTDIGADEYYWPKADYGKDEIVNFLDYSEFANNWLDVNASISLDTDNDVDSCDLALFCADWLWEAPWGDNFSFLQMGGGFGEEMFISEPVSPRTCAGGLMLSEISESISDMPDSLYAKAERFYAVNPAATTYISVQQKEAFVQETLDWLDYLWQSGELKDVMTYQEYIDFRESIKLSAESDY